MFVDDQCAELETGEDVEIISEQENFLKNDLDRQLFREFLNIIGRNDLAVKMEIYAAIGMFNILMRYHNLYFLILQEHSIIVCFQILAAAGNYLFKVNNRNTSARYEIFSMLTIKTPGRRLVSCWCLYC